MKNIKVETSSTQEPNEIEYADNELFLGDEEMKVGLGKVLTVEWVEILSKGAFISSCTFLPIERNVIHHHYRS
jgi:hypothetical protein